MADTDSAKQPTQQSPLAAILLAGGIAILLASFVWPGKSAGRAVWSEDQAKAYQAASVKLHSLSQETVAAGGANNDKSNREKLAKAEAEYKTIRAQLDSAIDRPKYISIAMRIAGSALAVFGLALLYRRTDD